jgi:ketosteroid isomerase-like protein
MMKRQSFTSDFKEQALAKVFGRPCDQGIAEVAAGKLFRTCSRRVLKREIDMVAFRKTAFLFGLTIALLGFAWRSSASDMPSPVAAVHAADDSWVKAYNSGDLDTVISLYDEHAVIYPPGASPVHGRAAIRAFFVKDNAEFLRGGLIFSLGTKPAGGVTANWGWSSGTYVAKDKSGHVVDTGWYFSVSRKVAGKWLYVRDAWNSDVPSPQTQSQAPAKK